MNVSLLNYLRNRDHRKLIFLFILFLWQWVDAQQLSLDSIFQRIENNNPALLSYQNKIKSEDALVRGAGAWMAPTLGAEWDDVPYKFDPGKSTVRITLMQEFPNKKVIQAKTNYLNSISATSKNELEFQKADLFQRAKEAYYSRYISEQRIRIIQDDNKIIEMMIALAEKQLSTGKTDLATVYKLKARLSVNETMLIRLQNMIRSNNFTLNYLMSAEINQRFEIDTTNLIKNYGFQAGGLKFDSLDCKRSDIMKMNSQINTMQLNQQLTSLNSKPVYGMRLGHYTMFEGMPSSYAVMATIKIPVAPWSAKGYRSEVKSMKYSIDAMEENKQNMINMAKQMISMYLNEMESERSEMDGYSKNVIPAYQRSLDASLLAYSQNTGDLNFTLMGWDDLQMAQSEYLNLLEAYLKTQSLYEKALQIR